MRPPAAVLWDMDGTLVDTEPYWIETEQALAARHGGTWTEEDRSTSSATTCSSPGATSASTWAST